MRVIVVDSEGAAHDAEMPSLSSALNPDRALSQLKSCLKAPDELNVGTTLQKIQVIQYKPGRRCVIEYHLKMDYPDGSCETLVLIGKVRSKHRGTRAYKRLNMIWNAGFQSGCPDRIMVPRPVGFFQDGSVWLQQKVPGRVASDLLWTERGKAIAQQIAKASHKLHQAKIETKRRHRMSDELRILREKLPLVSQMEKSFSAPIARILEAAFRLGASVPEPVPTGIHRDFHSDQVIVNDEELYLIDFDLFCEGDPGLDIGNFIGHITEQSLRTLGDPNALIDREEAMEETFVACAGEKVRPAVKAYAMLTLVRHIYISTLTKIRRSFTKDLIELCGERLGVRCR